MVNSKLKIQKSFILFCILHFAFCISTIFAQSTSQSYPTPITTNEISGTIKPRDIGDSRLTDYFYTFNSGQGDVFINLVTTNFNGDIDIFNADGLKSITKIVVFADSAVNETGRVIYFRKPEKLILRVEGRTPNDDAATFKIKFAGSFIAAAPDAKSGEPQLPEVTSSNQTDVRVNSVGTIIAVKPKPSPSPIETAAKADDPKETVTEIIVEMNAEKSVVAETVTDKNDERKIEVSESGQKLEVVVTDNSPTEKENSAQEIAENKTEKSEEVEKSKVIDEAEKVEKITINGTDISKSENETAVNPSPKSRAAKLKIAKALAAEKTKKARAAKIAEPNPLENIRLIVLLKDGEKIEQPMSEVLKVGVDKGILTIISKNGKITRHSILDVAKMTIE